MADPVLQRMAQVHSDPQNCCDTVIGGGILYHRHHQER